MPTIDYTCSHCGHSFQRVILKGEEDRPVTCPHCKARDAKPVKGAESLFDGIASFSTLAKDTS
jgi:putative FmdB family regulatory protein